MKFAFVAAEKASAPVALLCKVLGVSRSGFYASQARGPSTRANEDAKLAVAVAAAHKAGCGAYGSPRVHEELKADGRGWAPACGSHHERARPRRPTKTAIQGDDRFEAQPSRRRNILDRKFEVDAPDAAWVTDITYIWTAEGWLYVAAILDLSLDAWWDSR